MSEPVNIDRAFGNVTEFWSPKVVGRVNDQYVKLARVKGSLTWHRHDAEDEMFLVIKGRLRIEIEGRDDVLLEDGEFFIVPRGVRHNPVAEDECLIMLIETVSTSHTGDVIIDRTRSIEDQLS